jgi:excisionase family DNA binding protein
MENNYLTAEEASKLLNLSRVSLYKLAKENKISNIKIGGNVLFLKSAIEKFGSITIDDSKIAKNKKQIGYWMIPRSVRKLVTLQEMIKNDYRNGIIGGQWKGTRTNHLKRDKNLQDSGLRGKSTEGFVDSNPGGARTDVALLAALGFYAFDREGNIELTYQGEQMLLSTDPASIITEQLFQFRYPSPYSKSINMDSSFKLLFPYRFLFKLLTSDKLMDDGNIVADDGMIRLTQSEIAYFVITEAKQDKDIDKVIELISNSRKLKETLAPSDTLKNIANTFINNMEITGFIQRDKKSSICIKDSAISKLLEMLDKDPRKFEYEIGKENEFQHRLGMDPSKTKFTRSQTSNRTGGELAVQHLLIEELRNNPMTKDMITPALIKDLAQRAGTTEDIANKIVDSTLKEDPRDIFSKQYEEYSSSGRSFAREFELSTTKIISELAGNANWTGKEGKSPDVTFILTPNENNNSNHNCIIDCKAEKKYNISNDHFNRMTVEDTGYIPAYNANLFVYVANGFGTNFVRNLKKVENKCNIPGSGITAEVLLYLLEKHRELPFTHSELLFLFTSGKIITVADINLLFSRKKSLL